MAAPPRAVAAPPPFGYLAVRAAAEKRSSRIAVDFQTHGFAAFLKRSALRMSTGAVDYGAKFRFWCTTSHAGTRKPANLTQKWRIGTMKSGKSGQGAVGERTLTSRSRTPVHQKRRSAPFSRQPSCGAKQRRRPKANRALTEAPPLNHWRCKERRTAIAQRPKHEAGGASRKLVSCWKHWGRRLSKRREAMGEHGARRIFRV